MFGIAGLVSGLIGLFGGAMPRFFEIFEKKMSFAQELKIRELDFKNRMQEHAMQLELAKANISAKIDESLLDAFREEVIANAQATLAVEASMNKPTGFAIIDFMNAIIRPLFFMAVLGQFVVLMIAYCWSDPTAFTTNMVSLYALTVEGVVGWICGVRTGAAVIAANRIK